MKQWLFFVAILLSVCLLISPSPAAEPSPFSAAELGKLLKDFPLLADYLEKNGQNLESMNDPSAAKQLALQENAQAWLKKNGWSAERFSYVLGHVGEGYVALEVQDQSPEIQSQLAEAMNTPGLTPEMKAQMAAAMGEVSSAGKAEGVPESEMALIRKNRGKIGAMLEGVQ